MLILSKTGLNLKNNHILSSCTTASKKKKINVKDIPEKHTHTGNKQNTDTVEPLMKATLAETVSF